MNPRQREILQLYQQGERNFQRENLRGLSFKREDLSDADFSFADLRGTNFRGANLTGAKFCGAKAGLQRRWAVLLVGVSLLVSALLGAASGLASLMASGMLQPAFIQKPHPIALGVIVFVALAAFFIFSILQGYITAIITIGLSLATAVAIGGIFYGTVGGVGTGTAAVAIFIVVVVALAVIITLTIFVARVMSGAFVAVVGVTVAAMVAAGTLAVAEKVEGAMLDALSAVESWESRAIAGGIAVAAVLLGSYIGWQANSGDEKHSLVRKIAVAFAATGGTSFRGANLTDANFTAARLKSTDFRGTNITRTCWRDTVKLDRIRPGETYLKDAKVRELVRTGQGENLDFHRLNLQGTNLKGTNLTNASFIEANLNSANLQDANLSCTKLVGTFLDQADFTGSTLTGAFIEDWGITTKTILKSIKCDYVYMRLPQNRGRPDFLKLPTEESLDERLRRKPADEDKIFEEGEFVDFIKPFVNTLDLYHNQGVDPRIAGYSFEKLQKDHPEAEIKIRSVEFRGENNDKLLIRADTTPEANHSVLDQEYFETYNELKALSAEQLRAILAHREKDIEWYKGVLSAAVNRPGVNIGEYSNQGGTNMSGSSGDEINAQEIHGAVGNRGKIDGLAGSGREIYGLAGKGEIKDSAKIARTIYESQEQNLAQAAKDIQELLEQLDKTYPSDTMPGKVKIAEEVITQIDNNQTKAERILSAIKSGGVAAFQQFLNHPASSFVIAALEDWQKSK
ncbi:pentapeptide repeat-containing protein [Dapis sp. BLCC M229]|uniref:pentapeptide repeat-containing protein n=1 Tax=Dapis sp. BLCC M229 TaxID=3400188 RepID=UPI003CEFD0CF